MSSPTARFSFQLPPPPPPPPWQHPHLPQAFSSVNAQQDTLFSSQRSRNSTRTVVFVMSSSSRIRRPPRPSHLLQPTIPTTLLLTSPLFSLLPYAHVLVLPLKHKLCLRLLLLPSSLPFQGSVSGTPRRRSVRLLPRSLYATPCMSRLLPTQSPLLIIETVLSKMM